MSEFLRRADAKMPFQDWNPFPPEAIVQVKNYNGDSKIAQAKDLWWGYTAGIDAYESVIVLARRLDTVYAESAPQDELELETKARRMLNEALDAFVEDVRDVIDYKVNDSIDCEQVVDGHAQEIALGWVLRILVETVADDLGEKKVSRFFDDMYYQISAQHCGPEDFSKKAKPYYPC